MLSNLKISTKHTLSQINDLLKQMSNDAYSEPLDILSGSTIGMHVRHILEFYQCLLFGVAKTEIVNYDKRQRNLLIETDILFAQDIIEAINTALHSVAMDMPICVEFAVGINDETNCAPSSISRELYYLSEHTVHHMAILKMAFKMQFPNLMLPENFGVASSTVKYKNNVHSNVSAA